MVQVAHGRLVLEKPKPTSGTELVTTNKERVVIVLDCSSSMHSLWEGRTRQLAAAEAVAVLAKGSNPAQTKLGLVAFATCPTVICDITDQLLDIADNAYPQGIGGTTIYSLALSAAAELNPQRIIFLSDGAPTEDTTKIYRICQTLADLKIKVDTIGIGAADSLVLKEISRITHGISTICETPAQLARHFGRLETSSRLRLEYMEEK